MARWTQSAECVFIDAERQVYEEVTRVAIDHHLAIKATNQLLGKLCNLRILRFDGLLCRFLMSHMSTPCMVEAHTQNLLVNPRLLGGLAQLVVLRLDTALCSVRPSSASTAHQQAPAPDGPSQPSPTQAPGLISSASTST